MMYNISKHDYDRVSFRENSEYDSFKILVGEFAGTIVTFGKLVINEPANPENDATLSFEYEIEETPLVKEELQASEAFTNYIGDMLINAIQTALDDGNFRIGDKKDGTSDSNDYIEELDQ